MTSIKKKLSFRSSALADDTFEVVSFSGTEGLSRLYIFDISLVADSDEIELESVIQSRAKLTILRDDVNIVFHGILSVFEQMETAQGRTRYRAVLTPAFWRQTLTHHNQIFLDKTYPEIIEAALKDGGLTSLDYRFNLTGTYELHEYICQYNESHFNFISRLMEREGIYFYFEQGADSEKLIITDSSQLHSVMDAGMKMYYSQISGLDETSREEVIKSLICSQKILPARVLLKDYNYRKPLLDLAVEAPVSERGLGDVFIYGEHFSTPEEGNRLARVRAEELKCRGRVYLGESLIPYLRPGYIFELAGHNRNDFNISYLTTDISHNGDQSFMLTAGLDETATARELSPYYRNSFTAINSASQFRPERTTGKPRISGTINAQIDSEGSGQYAEIDREGRYKVRLPFDLSGSKEGKASSWLRMAQPYAAAGNETGMHFPLHKGTEVLLTFIDGDPDRPIISAAVPNPQFPSPINENNSSQSRIKTAGNNLFHMEDQQGGERILLHTPKANSWIRLGTPSDQPTLDQRVASLEQNVTNIGAKIFSNGGFSVEAAWENKLLYGQQFQFLLGSRNDVLLGTELAAKLAASFNICFGVAAELVFQNKILFSKGSSITHTKTNDLVASDSVEIKVGTDPKDIKEMAKWFWKGPIVAGLTAHFVTLVEGIISAESEDHRTGGAIAAAALASLAAIMTQIPLRGSWKEKDFFNFDDTSPYLSRVTLKKEFIDLNSPTIRVVAGELKQGEGEPKLEHGTAEIRADRSLTLSSSIVLIEAEDDPILPTTTVYEGGVLLRASKKINVISYDDDVNITSGKNKKVNIQAPDGIASIKSSKNTGLIADKNDVTLQGETVLLDAQNINLNAREEVNIFGNSVKVNGKFIKLA